MRKYHVHHAMNILWSIYRIKSKFNKLRVFTILNSPSSLHRKTSSSLIVKILQTNKWVQNSSFITHSKDNQNLTKIPNNNNLLIHNTKSQLWPFRIRMVVPQPFSQALSIKSLDPLLISTITTIIAITIMQINNNG